MKKAFSLVEMIVVIGIIAVLMAFLLPALTGASESAKAAKCLANMHAIAMGVQAKAMSDGYYPLAGSRVRKGGTGNSSGTTVVHGWIGWCADDPSSSYISPYSTDKDARRLSMTNSVIWQAIAKNRDVFVCPTHRELAHRKLGGKDKYGPLWSYAMNASMGWNSSGKVYNNTMKGGPQYETLGYTAKTLLIAELPALECGNGVQKAEFSTSATLSNDPILQYEGCEKSNNEIIGFNHRQGKRDIIAHVCFVDGHTEKFKLPRNAKQTNLRKLTKWLCCPQDPDDNKRLFDIVVDGDEYKQLKN